MAPAVSPDVSVETSTIWEMESGSITTLWSFVIQAGSVGTDRPITGLVVADTS